jgi:hypothetical protein
VIKNEILELFVNRLNVQVFNDSVKETLNKIRNNEQFYCISFYEEYSQRVEEKSGKSLSFAINFEQFLDAKYDEWYDDFYQRFHPIRYYKEIMTIGPVISSSKIPSDARSYFDEIRECYALELNASAVALCRAVMEMCLTDKLLKKRYYKHPNVVPFNLPVLINDAKKAGLLDGQTKQMANQIKQSAKKILHPKNVDHKSVFTKMNTFEIITNTIKVIERLYA